MYRFLRDYFKSTDIDWHHYHYFPFDRNCFSSWTFPFTSKSVVGVEDDWFTVEQCDRFLHVPTWHTHTGQSDFQSIRATLTSCRELRPNERLFTSIKWVPHVFVFVTSRRRQRRNFSDAMWFPGGDYTLCLHSIVIIFVFNLQQTFWLIVWIFFFFCASSAHY